MDLSLPPSRSAKSARETAYRICSRLHIIDNQSVRPKDSTIRSKENQSNCKGRKDEKKNLKQFPLGCRTTPNPDTVEELPPAEVLILVKLKTIHSALRLIPPKHPNVPRGNPCKESTIDVKDFRPDHPAWTREAFQRKMIPEACGHCDSLHLDQAHK